MGNTYLQQAKAIAPYLQEVFFHLHKNPELSKQEYQTQAFILSELEKMGIEATPIADTGVVGIIRGGKPGKTVAFRADMDALPIEEATGLPYKSQNPGVMHACGHDSHMTILLGLAKIMSTKKTELSGNIKLFFQPAEEKEGGARRMIAAGCMEDPAVDGVFFSHCTPLVPFGKINARTGSVSAASNAFTVTFQGKGCHGAAPHKGSDPIVAACQVVTALQTISSRRNDPADPIAVTVGTIHAGTAGNIIPDTCVISGTIRTMDAKTRQRAVADLRQIVSGIAAAMGVEVEISMREGYAATVNNDAMVELVRRAGAKVLGEENVGTTGTAAMGAEDFSYFCEVAPGCYYRFGVGTPGAGNIPVHNAGFQVDLNALPYGAAMYAQIAQDFLNES